VRTLRCTASREHISNFIYKQQVRDKTFFSFFRPVSSDKKFFSHDVVFLMTILDHLFLKLEWMGDLPNKIKSEDGLLKDHEWSRHRT